MKRILFCIVATMFVSMTFAQYPGGPQQQRREFSPEEIAQRQTMVLHEALQLDSIQLQAVFLISYADALTMQDSINARHERMEKMRAEGKKPERMAPPSQEQMQAMMEMQKQREQVRNEQMKTILTPEQYEKYLQYMKDIAKGGRPMGRAPRRGTPLGE